MPKVGDKHEVKDLVYHIVEVIPTFSFQNRRAYLIGYWMEDPKNIMPDGSHFKSQVAHLFLQSGQTIQQILEEHYEWYMKSKSVIRSLPKP